MDSQAAVATLFEVDPQFVDLCKALYGDAVDPELVWESAYGVAKAGPDVADVAIRRGIGVVRGHLVPKAPKAAPKRKPDQVVKAEPVLADDEVMVTWEGTFEKADSDKRQAFGWASVVEVDGQPVVDLQGDFIAPEDMEDAAYTFVRKSRVGGTQHARDESGDPVKAGELIESIAFTDEKYEALAKSWGMDPSVFENKPRAWWVGFQYDDEATWEDIKAGRKTGFSVHGVGKRVPVEL